MPNTREKEKLIELLDEAEEWADHRCDELECENCPADKMKGNCVQQLMVDRLIANGVTIATDNNVGDKMTPTADKWIPVTERLPEYHKEVLTRSKMGTSGHSFAVAELLMVDDVIGWVFDDGFEPQDIAEITHWMPLPEPPKGE